MTQRVNLQFSVNIDELPAEIQRIVDKAANQLNQSYELCDEIRDSEELFSLSTIQKIDLVRQQLASTDQTLLDTHNLINGFLNFLTNVTDRQQNDVYSESVEEIEHVIDNAGGGSDEEPDKE